MNLSAILRAAPLCALGLAACADKTADPSFPPSNHPGCETAESCDARCSQGDGAACAVMGVAARHGTGVAGGARKAFTYFQAGCAGGDGRSCANVGYAYSQGTLMEPDHQKAAHYLDEACQKGFMMGCKDLGSLYHVGRGVERDDARAIELFEKACDASIASACALLGMMMPDRLIPEDRAARALPLLVHDCDPREDPDPGVCTAAARLYAAGRGAPKDPARAAQLFATACKRGDQIACKLSPPPP